LLIGEEARSLDGGHVAGRDAAGRTVLQLAV
jgi:hypothetical protein